MTSSKRPNDERMPLFVPVLLAITLAYLLVEISFASFLVDLLGGRASADAIERAEHAGRLISGAALALAVWGIQVPRLAGRRAHPLKWLTACALSATLCVSGVYYGERLLIDGIASVSPAGMRQQAARALAVQEELFVDSPSIIGIEAPSVAAGDDTWNAFRGLFPFIALYDEDVLDRTAAGPEAAVDAGIATSLPDASVLEQVVLPKLFDAMQQRYEAYVRAYEVRDSGVSLARSRVRDGWERNVAAMQRLNVIGPNATSATIRRGVPRIRQAVRDEGVPVPDGWSPTDQEAFQRAAWGAVMPDINRQYNDGIAAILGHPVAVPPNLPSYDAFLRDPGVQEAMHLDLGTTGSGILLLPGLSGERLSRLHAAYSQGLASRLKAAYFQDSSAFSHGREFADLGEDAVRAMVVPPMALSLSLLGAIVHLVKMLNYLLSVMSYGRSRLGLRRFLQSHPRMRLAGAMAAAMALVVGSYSPASAIVDSDYYRIATQKMASRMGLPADVGVEWTISMQRIVAPAGDLARATGLFAPIEAYLVADGTSAAAPAPEPSVLTVASADAIPFPLPRPASR